MGSACQLLAMLQDSDVKSTHGWVMIWCHERCHKPDTDDFRKVLHEAIGSVGGKLVCLKKASVFERWLHRQQHVPYVMLCDWREAKPCMEVCDQECSSPPRCTIVCAATEKQYTVAAKWAQGVGQRHIAHVIR